MGTGKLHTLQNNFGGLQLSTEYVSPTAIRTSRRRVRKHSKSQLTKLQAAISRWGFNVPLLVDDQYELVSGFARLDAATALKLETVPVIALSHLTREQLELFRIFEDKIGEDTDWCEEALVEVFGELRLADGEIVLEDSGFSVAEIDTMKGRLRTDQLNDLDDASEPGPDLLSVSRPGDLWRCGRHRLMCADATLPQNITSLVGDGPVHQVITDPPYALPTKFFSSTGKHPDFLMGAGEMNASEFTAFLSQFLAALAPHLMDGALIYTFMDWRHNVEIVRAAQEVGLSYKNRLVWVKPVGGMGSLYRSAHEDIHVFKHGSAPARNNIELGKWGRNRTNVLHYPGVMTSGGRKKALALHPTVKNVALVADLMLDASAEGDLILDSFGGSGTTMIAAEKVGRRACLCELSPSYVDTALRRWSALGVSDPILEATGQTLSAVAEERSKEGGNGEAA